MRTMTTGSRPATLLARTAGLGLAFAALAACGGDSERRAGDVQGIWALVADTAGSVYLRVGVDDVEVWMEDRIADCFERTLYTVIEVDGATFRLDDGADTIAVQMRRDGDELILTAFEDSEAYAATDVDLASLPLCGQANPGAVCAELPPLAVGNSLVRTLSPADPENSDGSHRDLYRLDIQATTSLVVEMSSTDVDSYLVLYDASGADIVEFNDDLSDLTLDARIAPTLEPGCWILMATTAGPDDFGDYLLRVSNP